MCMNWCRRLVKRQFMPSGFFLRKLKTEKKGYQGQNSGKRI